MCSQPGLLRSFQKKKKNRTEIIMSGKEKIPREAKEINTCSFQSRNRRLNIGCLSIRRKPQSKKKVESREDVS